MMKSLVSIVGLFNNPVHIMLNMGLIDTLKFFLLNDSFLG